jgi:tripeptide aminopeptidase
MDTTDIREELVSRFFRYVAIASQSDAHVMTLPSSPGQLELATLLAQELREIGVDDVVLDQRAIVTGIKRGNSPTAPRIGFIAHLDTVDVGLSPIVRPQIFRFNGEDICLNREQDVWLRVGEHPEIVQWKGEDIITGDGTSVLGADNKAAIAIVMTLLSRLGPDDLHGDIAVAFVPDEEIGLRGAKALDLKRFPCDFAYTVDCCELGEVVVENFNAASVEIVFTGVTAHPMAARNVLVNPLLMATDFIGLFDRRRTPELSSGREGFYWFKDLVANDSTARMTILVREFDRAELDRCKRFIHEAAQQLRARYPTGSVKVRVEDTYRNMAEGLEIDNRAACLLLDAMQIAGVIPKLIPMRGGTDGAVLTARGVPTPNFFTGAHNFHSMYEFLPVAALEKSFEVASAICAAAATSADDQDDPEYEDLPRQNLTREGDNHEMSG